MEIQTNRSIRDFLLAVRHIDSSFSGPLLIQMRKTTLNIFEIIENFRHNVRMLDDAKPASSHSAFAAYDSKESNKNSNDDSKKDSSKENENKTSFRGKSIEPPECICGKNHWYSKCFYLNKKIRPSGWKADSEIQEKVQKAMKEDDFKAKVERSLKRSNDMKKNSENENNKTNSSNDEDGKNMNYAFAIVDDSIFSLKTSSSKSKPLRSSWILDHAATIHVCNDTMTHRFIKKRDGDDRTVTAEDSE